MEEKDYHVLVTALCLTILYCVFWLGYFLEPTIFTDVEDHMMVAKEESFGPVMIVSVFENGLVL